MRRDCGSMCTMIDRSPAPIRLRRCSPTRAIGEVITHERIYRPGQGSCRPMPKAVTANSMLPDTCLRPCSRPAVSRRSAQVLRTGRRRQRSPQEEPRRTCRLDLSDRSRGRAADRCSVRYRARHHRQGRGRAARGAPGTECATHGRASRLAHYPALQAFAQPRPRRGHQLHAAPVGRVHPLPRRRPGLPHQQRGRTCAALRAPWPEGVAVLRIRSRGQRAAVLYTLIQTARLNDVDPQAWLAEIPARIADHPIHRLAELLPWNWQAQRTAIAA